MAGLEERLKGIAVFLGSNVDDYYLGLDVDADGDDVVSLDVEELNAHQDTLVEKAAGSDRRPECELANHPGAKDCHLGLDQVARDT